MQGLSAKGHRCHRGTFANQEDVGGGAGGASDVHQWHVDAPQWQLDNGLWRELRLFGSWQGRLLLLLVQQQYLPPGTESALELLWV